MEKTKKRQDMEVITFRKGDRVATIVTDGVRFRSYEWNNTKAHPTLSKAISYLEIKGYGIDMESFNAC